MTKIINDLNDNDLNEIVKILKTYMLISKNYQENRFKDTEIADNLRNKISDIIDRNIELNN